MTPKEMNKELTTLLSDNMNSLGFTKKRICEFGRKSNDCELYFSFYFTRDRGLPGTYYSMFPTLSFRCVFLVKDGMGLQPIGVKER